MKNLITYTIAFVWLINGLYCKLLNFVPRHQEIVSRVLGIEYADIITKGIGILEIAMVVWILSKYKPKLNAVAQISIILLMNAIEFILAKDLLLFGYLNGIFALIFSGLIYYSAFILKENHV